MATTVLSKLKGGRRLAQIQHVLERRGLGQLLGPLSHGAGLGTRGLPAALPGDELCAALAELGPLYIRLGREAAARMDVLPPGLIESLQRLDSQESLQGKTSDGVLRRGLFSDVVAAAGRWRTVLHTKQIDEARREFEPLMALAELLEARLPTSRPPKPSDILRELAEQLEREWSLPQRAAALERYQQTITGDERLYVGADLALAADSLARAAPDGGPLQMALAELDYAKRRDLAETLALMGLEQLLRYGWVVLDWTLNNLWVTEQGKLAIVEFGVPRDLTPQAQTALRELLQAIEHRDADLAVEALLRTGLPGSAPIEEDLEPVLAGIVQAPPSPGGLSKQAQQMIRAAGEAKIGIPGSLAQAAYALGQLEATCHLIFPGYSLREASRLMLAELYPPSDAVESAVKLASKGMNLAKEMVETPRAINRLLGRVQRGNVKLKLEVEELDKSLTKFAHGVNRLSTSIVLAGVLVASAVIMSTDIPPKLWGYPALGLIGVVISGFMGLWLLYTILTSEK